jgi:hypothetical protein
MMTRGVLVIGETPSLGRSIFDLLESSGIPVRYVPDLTLEPPLAGMAHRYGVVVVACNGSYCATARAWAQEGVSDVDLVVVGARDRGVTARERLHVVELPLVPTGFLALIRSLLAASDPRADPGSSSPGTRPSGGAPGGSLR